MYGFDQNGKVSYTYGTGDKSKDYEVVLLGDENSASASEVLIAGLRENLGSKFFGKKTYGKGTVQEMVNLSDGTQYKLTTKKWLTPDGNWINDTEGIIPDEEVEFAFAAQKNEKFYEIFNTCIFCLTNKRILIGTKRILWGSFLYAITPDLYNDTQIYKGLVWGKVTIDTVKEKVILTNVSKNGLDIIETTISEFMMKEKRTYNNEK